MCASCPTDEKNFFRKGRLPDIGHMVVKLSDYKLSFVLSLVPCVDDSLLHLVLIVCVYARTSTCVRACVRACVAYGVLFTIIIHHVLFLSNLDMSDKARCDQDC